MTRWMMTTRALVRQSNELVVLLRESQWTGTMFLNSIFHQSFYFSYTRFKEYLRTAFEEAESPEGTNPISEIMASVQRQARNAPFSEAEVQAALEHAEGDNLILVADDTVTLI